MSLDVTGIVSEVSSHLKRLGIFSTVTTHEPKSTPKKGLTASVWVNSIGPSPANSGLSKTSVRIELSIRLLMPMLTDPQDDIDLSLLRATDAVMNSFSSDYTLGGAVESIDLLGRTGSGLSAETGYLQIDSNQIMRVMDVTVPLLINDNWDQVP